MAHLSTIAAFGFEDFNPSTLLPLYRRLGCLSCQFYRNDQQAPDPSQVRAITADAGLSFDSVHGLFGPQLDPSSPDETVRRAAVETCRGEGELALRLGGPMVVVHPAPWASNAREITQAMRAQRLGPLQHSLEDLARVGGEQGVTYLVENIPDDHHFGSDPTQLARIVRQLNDEHVRMCFDTGHAHMTCDAPAAVLDAIGDVVSYVHVSDNDRTADAHKVPGQGTIDWEGLSDAFGQLQVDLITMLELFVPENVIKALINDGLASRLRDWLALVPSAA